MKILYPVFNNMTRLQWGKENLDIWLTDDNRIDFKKMDIELSEEQINYININLNK